MSYDVSIVRILKDGEEVEVAEYDSVTYNLRPIFVKVFNDEKGIYVLNDLPTKDAVPLLLSAIDRLSNMHHELKELEPENGWGNIDNVWKIIVDLLKDASIHKDSCVIEVT